MNDQPSRAGSIQQDALASIVVFLVALPLCMGIAIASGVPVAAGLITGIVGGILVGTLAGAPLQVSGPAAGLTVIVYDIVQDHGLEHLGMAVLIGGVVQMSAGLLRLGQWFRAVSPAVIKGMLAGIGVLIFASQFHVMVDDKPRGSGLQNLATIPEAIAKGLPLPDVSSREQREYRTHKLKQIGRLHERQVQIHESVAERVASDMLEDDYDAAQKRVRPLIEQQAQMSAELEALVEDIDASGVTFNEESKQQTLVEAADQALAASRSAEAALKQDIQRARITQAAVEESLQDLLGELKNHRWAAKVGIVTIALIVIWRAASPRQLKMLPGPLIAVVVVTAACAIWALPVLYVEVPQNLFDEIHIPTLTALQDASWLGLLQSGVVIAVVASAETLLCATAVDQMHSGPRAKYDKELFAQGVGNTTCGFLGALPMTGVIVRSSANVDSGATTRLSAILHGIWLLIFVVALGWVLNMIPTAGLAAMLVYTGYKLMDPKSIKDLWEYGKGEVFIYAATVGTIVAVDLLTGVLVGIALSGVKLLYTFSHLDLRYDYDEKAHKAELHLEGAATFIRLPVLASQLEKVPNGTELHVYFDQLSYIDHACLDLLMNWAKQHEASGGSLVIDWESLHANFKRASNNKPAIHTAKAG